MQKMAPLEGTPRKSVRKGRDCIRVVDWDGLACVKDGEEAGLGAERRKGHDVGVGSEDGGAILRMGSSYKTSGFSLRGLGTHDGWIDGSVGVEVL